MAGFISEKYLLQMEHIKPESIPLTQIMQTLLKELFNSMNFNYIMKTALNKSRRHQLCLNYV
jgi:hypothetical protein